MQFAAGEYPIWKEFCLNLRTPLSFQAGCRYHLSGPNGSGKSSFIHRVLLPELRKQNAYIILLEQQMHLQLYALKAHAAIFHPEQTIHDESDVRRFLLEDLQRSYQLCAKAIWILADESHDLNALARCTLPHTLIYTAHHQKLEQAETIHFQPLSSSLSEVYV